MQTQPTTITAFLGELIETHVAKCDQHSPIDDRDNFVHTAASCDIVPHIVCEANATSANITKMTTTDSAILLELDSDQVFVLTLEEVAPR